MKRLSARVHQAANVLETAPAPDATGVDGVVGYHVPHSEWDAAASADSVGPPLADLSALATGMPVPSGAADPAAGPMAVFSADTGIGANDSLISGANLEADASVSGFSASLAQPTTDSFAAFITDAADSGSEDAADLTIDLDPVASATAPAVLTSLANPAADSFAAFSFGNAAVQAPQGFPYTGFDAAASAGGGGAFTGGSFAAATAAPAPADWASLANPPADFFTTPITESTVGANGATAAQVQQALDDSGLNVNGSGIRVGVLSDSFNDLGGAAADEADGALPPAADIDVIKDLASGGTDEGRAIMQIIHDIAPGADLAFYTAFDSEQDFANGILALAAAGCKVIVDDVAYFDEPFFQNGVVAQAIQTVEAEGVTYVTAAGNDAGNAYQAAWTPISGTYGGTSLKDAESFGGSLVQTVTINTEGTGYDVPLLLEWNQAYGAATSDLEILVFNSSGRLVGTATNASDGESTNPWVEYDFTRSGTYYVAIENLSGPNPGLIKEITEGDGLPATISGANVGSVFGHAMTPGAISAGAVSVADTPAFGVNPAVSESFSSSGAGTELLFADNGTALSSPDLLSPVAVSGVDDIATTLPGDLSDFYGTSAASASLAGAAALILSADPNLTPAEVEQLMEETALPMANAAVSGAGLVQIDPAVKDAESGIFESAITVAGTASDAVQGGAVIALLTGAPTITDVGQTNLESATISIANGSGNAVTGDELYVNGVQNGSVGNGVTASWNATTDTLTLTGIATIAVYETLLGEVTYRDTGTDLSTVGHPERNVTWAVFDGTTSFDTTSQVTIDRPPVANNDAASDAAGSTITAAAASGVLSIDSDLDGDKLTVTGVSDAASGAGSVGNPLASVYGHLTLNADGSYSYVANNLSAIDSAPAGSHPQDIFTYTVNDGDGGTATAELTITIDRPPVANNDIASDVVGSTITATAASGVLSIDSDLDGDKLTVTGVSDAASGAGSVGNPLASVYGHLTLNADGSYSYVANNLSAIDSAPAGSHPQDIFTYTVNDGDGGTATAELTITIDRPPVVTAANVALNIGQTSIAASSLFTASDPDGNTITTYGFMDTGPGHFVLDGVTEPNNQEIDVTAAQLPQLTYQSGAGVDTVEVRVDDGTLWSNWASFTVTSPSMVVVQTDTGTNGTTSLVEVGNSYALYNSNGSGPILQYGGVPVTAGEYGAWAVIGAVPTATGYEVAWKETGADAYQLSTTDSNGNIVWFSAVLSGSSTALESAELIFNQDLNGDGVIGPSATVIQTDTGTNGTTSLVEVGNSYALYNSNGSGPILQYGGVPVTAGEYGAWAVIGAVPTATGYEVAWKETGADAYQLSTTDSNGNIVWFSAVLSGSSTALESAELIFNQDLNGDGVIGPSATVIQTDTGTNGTTSLVEVGNSYALYNSNGSGPILQYGGVPVTAGEYGAWAVIGAVPTATGYEVAWKETGADAYQLSTTDSNGNIVWFSAVLSGSSTALESAELIFNQDLNGDGVIGPSATVIQTDTGTNGTTSLVEVGNSYALYNSNGSGPILQYGGVPVTAGEYGAWAVIGAVPTATGYEVAWKETGADAYQLSTTDSNGNIVWFSAVLSGSSTALESAELIFNQDLNGDGVIGPSATVIQTDTGTNGTTSLVEVGNSYALYNSNGSGPILQYGGVPVTAGEYGAWAVIGAVPTATGYEVAWKETGADAYQLSTTDSNGNIVWFSAVLSGSSTALESAELIFNQDLNGDGVIGPSATVINVSGDVLLTLNPLQQAATIDAGATLELAGADIGSVTFNGATGTLILDHSSEFSGEIFNFTGDGNLSTSDQIDLRDIDYGTGTTASYTGNVAGGTLSVTDAHDDTASISFSGDYINSTFSISSDGNGGTLVVDPAVTQALSSGAFLFNELDSTGKYTVSVSPQDGGLGYVGSFMVDAATAANGQESVGWQFNLGSNSVAQTATQSYDVTLTDTQPNGATTTATQSLAVTIGGPGNDTFVFHPGMGADVIANATSSDTIELDGFSSVTSINQLQALLTEAQTGQSQSLFESANGGHDTVINLDNHDSITLANVQISALHASNFIIH